MNGEKLSSPSNGVHMKRQRDGSDDVNVTPKKKLKSNVNEHQPMQNQADLGSISKMASILSNATTMELEIDPNMYDFKPNSCDIDVSDRLYLKSLLYYLEKIDASRKLSVRAKIENLLLEELYA